MSAYQSDGLVVALCVVGIVLFFGLILLVKAINAHTEEVRQLRQAVERSEPTLHEIDRNLNHVARMAKTFPTFTTRASP
jgi:hypothetical protein